MSKRCSSVTVSLIPFLSIDIQLVSLVIYARFLYHYGITILSLATWIGNRYSAYTYLHINILQIKQTINTLFPSLQITRLFYVKTAIKQVKPGGFHCPARYFSCRTPPCCPLLHPGVPVLYTRMLRMATWGCLRNYVLVFAKKREGFCGMKNRILPI